MKQYWALVGLVVMAATVSTQPTQCVRTPDPKLKLPPGYVVYTTQMKSETPYEMAERFYGHGYMEYKIRKVNQKLLTREGVFPLKTAVLIPPDDDGRAVDLTRMLQRPY